MLGRSDATLNPGGVRIGTAEIYRQLEQMEEIDDSVVVGQDWKNDIRVILFVKPAEGIELTDELKNKIKQTIRTNASPRHVPAKIIRVPAVPYTLNMKKVELAVKKDGTILGLRDHYVANTGAPSSCPGWAMSFLTGITMPGPYAVQDIDVLLSTVVTNKPGWNASRGYGKEVTALALELSVDNAARELGIDPVDIRPALGDDGRASQAIVDALRGAAVLIHKHTE